MRPQSRSDEMMRRPSAEASPVYAGVAISSVLASARAAVAAGAPPQRIDPNAPPSAPPSGPPGSRGAWGTAAVAACRQQDLNRQLEVRRQLLELQRQLEARQKELGAMHDAAAAEGEPCTSRPDAE